MQTKYQVRAGRDPLDHIGGVLFVSRDHECANTLNTMRG